MWSQRTRAALTRLAIPLAILVFAVAARAQPVELVAAGSLNLAL